MFVVAVCRRLGNPIRTDNVSRLRGVRWPRSGVRGGAQPRKSRRQESPRHQGDGDQTPTQTQSPEHSKVQRSLHAKSLLRRRNGVLPVRSTLRHFEEEQQHDHPGKDCRLVETDCLRNVLLAFQQDYTQGPEECQVSLGTGFYTRLQFLIL